MVAVTARISGRDLGSVMSEARRAVAEVSLPPGTRVEYAGLYREQQSSLRSLGAVLVGATLLVGLVLLFLHESTRALVAVAAAVAVSVSAVLLGLYLSGSELNVASLMGLRMVVGITSETAVFFLSHWREARARLDPSAALLETGASRLRPILMTGIAAALALAPLALGIGTGSAMLQPLAIAILCGLVAALPAVLLILPPILVVLQRGQG